MTMLNPLKFFTAGLFAFTLIMPPVLGAEGEGNENVALNEELAYTLGVQAYLYGYPTMDLYRTFYEETLDPNRGHHVTLNQFNFSRKLVTPEDDWVVTPNNDTLYNRAYFDLNKEPVILRIPEMGDRNYWFPIGDLYHNLNTSLSWDTVGRKGGDIALCAPDWKGVLPEGVRRVDVRTPMVWTVGRYQVNGPDDVAAVNDLQDKTKLVPFSEWGKGSPARSAIDPDGYPVMRRADLTNPEVFFTVLNEIWRRNPPQPSDMGILNQFHEIGLHPSQNFEWEKANKSVRRGLQRAVKTGHAIVSARTKTFAPLVNGWIEAILDADMSEDIVNHAGAAMMGLLYSQKEVSTYHVAYVDGDGKTLNGSNRYVLHLSPPPPVDAFWSLTMYDAKNSLLSKNPIDRYSIGDRTPGLVVGEDGSVTIYLQHEAQKGEKQKANWLPTPKGEFYLALREYSPQAAILTRDWVPAGIEKK